MTTPAPSPESAEPNVCPMCGSDGSGGTPGCGHCRAQLRSGVVIRSRQDPAPPEVKKLTKVALWCSLGHAMVLAIWCLAAALNEGVAMAPIALLAGAVLTSPAALVLAILNGVSFLREANDRAKKVTGALALLYAAICAYAIWLVYMLFTTPNIFGRWP